MSTLTERTRGSDFLKAYWDERYCFEAGTIQNKSGGAVTAGQIQVGYPLNLNGSQWETCDNGSEAGADGFLIDDKVVPALADNATTTEKYKILARGPAIVNADAIPAAVDGDNSFVLADLITRMAALNPPIMVLREPATTETQTT